MTNDEQMTDARIFSACGRLLVIAVVAILSVCGGAVEPSLARENHPSTQRASKTQVSKTDPARRTEQEKPKPSRLYTFRRRHDPNGIGKFYMGREIAHVMGFGPRGSGAEWLERNSREQEEKLSLLVKSLKLKPGHVVADIGAGSGVISMLMAEKLLPGGKVVAVDVQQAMLNRLKKNLKTYDITNVELLKGTEKSARLKPNSVDLIVLVDVYHEFKYPFEMILDLSKALKPWGRVAFVEYRMEDPKVPIKLVHKMSQAQVKKEIERDEFGLKWKETIDVLPRQHIVIFERHAESEKQR